MTRTTLSTLLIPAALSMSAQYTATVKTTVTKTESSDWRKWSDKECTINYPGTWTHEGTMGTDALAIFFAPADPAGGFRERVRLTAMDATGKTMDQILTQLDSDAPVGLTDVQKTAFDVEEDSAILEFMGSIEGQPVRVKREVTRRGNKAWVLTYMARQERFEDARYLADAMFLSFAVK